MAKTEKKIIKESIVLPDGVTAAAKDGVVDVKGPKTELSRNLLHRRIAVTVEDGKIMVAAKTAAPTRKDKMDAGTIASHLRNMVLGVTEGFSYKLKICSGHFPMNVSVANGQLVIKNFIGEKVPRTLAIKKGAEVKVEGETITVASADKEIAGMVVSDIEKLTRRPGFDNRVFQDGIYLIEKAGKQV